MTLGVTAARPDELLLQPEVTLLAQASWLLHPKLFGGPGEPETILGEPKTSLGDPGFIKPPEMTLLPLPFGIFRILDQNIG